MVSNTSSTSTSPTTTTVISTATTTTTAPRFGSWIGPTTVPMIAGFAGGIASTSLLLPLDIVKLRLQVTESANPNKPYRFFRILGGIVKYEGIRGLYQGWTPAVIGSAVSWGGYFYFYEGFKRQLIEYKMASSSSVSSNEEISDAAGTQSSSSPVVLTSVDNFVLACMAGAVMVAITNPVWLVKTRMQLQMRRASEQHNIKPYTSMMDAFRTIVREEGWMALYKGSGPAMLLTSHGGVQFVVYEYLRKQFGNNKNHSNNHQERRKDISLCDRLQLSAGYLAIGGVAKFAATTATYPLQLIKARMQQRIDSIELTDDGYARAVKREYGGIISTVRKIYTNEGIGGFFKGCIPNAVRVAPGAAVTFVVYELVTDLLS